MAAAKARVIVIRKKNNDCFPRFRVFIGVYIQFLILFKDSTSRRYSTPSKCPIQAYRPVDPKKVNIFEKSSKVDYDMDHEIVCIRNTFVAKNSIVCKILPGQSKREVYTFGGLRNKNYVADMLIYQTKVFHQMRKF